MKLILAVMLIGTSLTACSNSGGTVTSRASGSALTDEEKHRLYAAALAATESPLESETFKQVGQKIGVFDTQGNQNENYMGFVQAHVEWGLKVETAAFRRQIDTREKAGAYLNRYSP